MVTSMKILFISHSSQIGGAEKELFLILKLLPKGKYESHCMLPAEGPIVEKIRGLGVTIYISDLSWWVAGIESPLECFLNVTHGLNNRVANILNVIKSKKIDLVVTNTSVVVEGAIAAKIANVPHIWRIAEMLSVDPFLRPCLELKKFYSIITGLSDYVIACSKAVKKEIETCLGHSDDKIKVIYSGLDVSNKMLSEPADKDRRQTVFAAGFIGRRKGFMTLLKAAQLVHDAIPEAVFNIAGSVAEVDYYEDLLKERRRLKLDNIFNFIGFRSDIDNIMNKSSVFVLPSLTEPFGVVLLEAMNARIPIVATNSGGAAEAVVDGETGFIVPINGYKMMSEKIIYLLNNSVIAEKMGEAGFVRFKNSFSTDKFAISITDLFQRAVSEHKKDEINSYFRSNDVFGIVDDLILNRKDLLEKIRFYDRVHNSVPYKIYKKLQFIVNRGRACR